MSVALPIFITVGGNVTDLRRGYDVELAYRLKQYGCFFQYLPKALGNQYESKGFRELSADSELAGEASVALACRYPATETKLLGHFQRTRCIWFLLWQVLSFCNFSSQWMDRLHHWAAKRKDHFEWYVFLSRYYFWKGVRRAAPERTTWKRIFFLR
jgi:hypothetical protein